MIKTAFACYKFVTKQYANHYILFFFSCIESGIFPTKWNMTKVEPIHKRDNKQNVKNYRLVSLLPIFRKILERLLLQLNVPTFYWKRFNIFKSGFK